MFISLIELKNIRYEDVEISRTTTGGLFQIQISDKFPFSQKTLMSEKDKRPLFSFSNKRFMLGCFEDKYFSNFMIE